ncbi:hypothetical protein PZ61_0211485 [Streptomyces sp. MNU77]|uniref:hypothetical protein n=1 Tax=Streptomyces sp. MNU77 TaxID=1573406 RepID=UPI0005E71756|nr:hypothetical protein [Streptomyces sp. MNU77]OLO31102.1 hypothetical protein PZ61_0211485 [Streptomyces sp. MNU77]
MRAEYYRADSEDGDHIADPSEDALFMLFDDLNGSDNTFVVIRPDQDEPAWSASVTFLGKGRYEVVRRDTTRHEHEVVTETGIGRIALDLTIWMAARDFPERDAPAER